MKTSAYKNFLIFLFILGVLPGCGMNTSVSFNADLWKSDQYGCQLERLNLYGDLLDHQDELLGLNNRQIIKLLGNPERNELYRRNQKFFIYRISPSPACRVDYVGDSLFMFIRFNAVGLSQEVFIQAKPSFGKS